MASENGRVHPNCVNASNPYHECGMACLEKIAQGQGQGHKDIQKKKLDYRNGVKEGVIGKMKTEERKVNPNCIKASNPYHECDEQCFKINGETDSQGFKKNQVFFSLFLCHPSSSFPIPMLGSVKPTMAWGKSLWLIDQLLKVGVKFSFLLDYHYRVKGGVIDKKKDKERKVNPNCIKESNTYHEFGEHCFKRNGEADTRGVKKESGSWSFGRKSKESGSRPESPRAPRTPRVVDKVAVGGQKADAQRARSEYQPNKNVESENGKSLTSSEHFSREIRPEDHSFNKEKVLSTQAAPPSENVKMSDRSKDRPKENFTTPTGASPSKNGKDDKVQASHHEIYDSTEDVGEYIPSPTDQSRNFSFLGIDHITPGDSDDEEAQSVISDCVSVGKYHVRASISSILQSIINKYGDIAANCKLESNSMRAYYLECLCSVIQELQSTSLMQMTKAKVREMLAVLKDVESAQIDVDWLRNILNEISEAIEFRTQHQTIDAAKANCDNLLESTRKELESQMQELALKEKEVADLKERVAETDSRLSNLEFESNQLEQTIQATQSKVKKYSHKSLANEIL